jgi:HAMP domain-containing protein
VSKEENEKIWGIPTVVVLAIVAAVLGLAVWQGSTTSTIATMGQTIAQHSIQIKTIEDGRILNEQRLTRIETTVESIGRAVDRIEKKLDEIPPKR